MCGNSFQMPRCRWNCCEHSAREACEAPVLMTFTSGAVSGPGQEEEEQDNPWSSGVRGQGSGLGAGKVSSTEE